MVCTSQPLAAQAGLDILKKAATPSTLPSPPRRLHDGTGTNQQRHWRRRLRPGLDERQIIWLKCQRPRPMGIDPEELRAKYGDTLPKRGWVPVTVPGIPPLRRPLRTVWKAPFEELLEPAIRYAEEGYLVSPVISRLWDNAYNEFKPTLKDDYFTIGLKPSAPKTALPSRARWLPGKITRNPAGAGGHQVRIFLPGRHR